MTDGINTSSPQQSGSIIGDFLSGLVLGEYSKAESTSKTVGQVVGGVIPGYGQLADIRDTAEAAGEVYEGKQGSWGNLALALIGWIPLIGDTFKSASRASKRARGAEEILEETITSASKGETGVLKGGFYHPTIEGRLDLPSGTGMTDKFGNVGYSVRGSAEEQALALNHELVHSYLSPKFELLRGVRADIGMSAYERSSFCRYLEEALAETYAQVRVNGFSSNAILEGLSFPISNGYVTLSKVVTEAAVGTVVVGGVTYAAYLAGEATADRSRE